MVKWDYIFKTLRLDSIKLHMTTKSTQKNVCDIVLKWNTLNNNNNNNKTTNNETRHYATACERHFKTPVDCLHIPMAYS